ncbi:MAG TPA: NAD-dependent epimerase/dehydratase family protein [Acidimicrobiales bacterium]|nr:NAD-dependent epimerase/dehydratase family protein [Acidimicrobiales bacterium]
MGRRVLITGIATFWGGRVAQALEADPTVDLVLGLGVNEPTVELERTEYVRADESYSILARLVRAAEIDTIVHTHLIVDPTQTTSPRLHEINVIGTMNLVAAASAPESTVREVVVKSSTMVYGSTAHDPMWFSEDTPRSTPARTRVERTLEEAETYFRDFADDNPHVNVAVLRCSKVLGDDIVTPISRALTAPVTPAIAGFDPLFQFVHEDDVVRAILFAIQHRPAGVFNVAGDGVLPWSEVAAMCGRVILPLPPFGTELAAIPLSRLGIELPTELLNLLRFGRGVDNSRLKDRGFTYRYTTAGTVRSFAEGMRLKRVVGELHPTYRYQRDVEQFFRHSPAVVRDPGPSPD